MKPRQITVLTQSSPGWIEKDIFIIAIDVNVEITYVNNPEGQIKAYFYPQEARFQTLKMLS